jgi:vacuolar-type H+-ATPase subunit I/STV1
MKCDSIQLLSIGVVKVKNCFSEIITHIKGCIDSKDVFLRVTKRRIGVGADKNILASLKDKNQENYFDFILSSSVDVVGYFLMSKQEFDKEAIKSNEVLTLEELKDKLASDFEEETEISDEEIEEIRQEIIEISSLLIKARTDSVYNLMSLYESNGTVLLDFDYDILTTHNRENIQNGSYQTARLSLKIEDDDIKTEVFEVTESDLHLMIRTLEKAIRDLEAVKS